MAETKSDKGALKKGQAFLFLFGLPFFVAGCITGYFALRTMVTYYEARHWVETKATIQSVDLQRHSGDHSTTYKVVCTYAYEFGGRPYTGQRVGLSGGSDNFGSWQQDTCYRLKQAHHDQRPVICYVNPKNPQRAVLDREIQFGWLAFMLLFATVFGTVGGGLIGGSFYAGRVLRRNTALAEAYPSQPWMQRAEWINGIISPKLGLHAVLAWVLAFFWNAISSPILFFLPEEVAIKHNKLALIGLLFPLVGVGILIYAIRATIRKRKYGRSYFKLKNNTGVIGGHLIGELVVDTSTTSPENLEIALKCICKVTTRSGGKSSTSENTLWQDKQHIDTVGTTFGQTDLRVPINFQVPYDRLPTDNSDTNSEVIWRLIASGSTPGVDLALSFDVPVFRTESSDVSVGEAPAKIAAEHAVVESDELPLPDKLRREPGPDGGFCLVSSYFPGGGMVGMLLLFIVLFGGSTVVLANAPFGCIAWLFVFAFGGISLLLLFTLFSMFGTSRVRLGKQQLDITRKIGPFKRYRIVLIADIQEIMFKQSASSNDRRWYCVSANCGKFKNVPLAGMIEGELAAKWYVRQVEHYITAKQAV